MKLRWDFFKKTKTSETQPRSEFGDTHAGRPSRGTGTWRGPIATHTERVLIFLNIWFQSKGQFLLQRINWTVIRSSVFLVLGSYFAASAVSTYAAHSSFKIFLKAKGNHALSESSAMPPVTANAAQPRSSTTFMRDLILKRNVFNSEGTLAPDGDSKNERRSDDQNFEASTCVQEQLPVQVIGTIYTGDPKESVVIIKDSQVPDADIYRPGMLIIDHEDYEVYKVKQGIVEFRKGDQKVCIDLTGREPLHSVAGASAPRPEASESIDVGDEEMKNLLGPELARAMNEAKLIPDPAPGGSGIQGFRLLAVVPGSIYDRVKLQNEDLIIEVNGQSLKDPGQGYRLLESLQQQREITINFTRNGEPMVRKVRVK